MNLFKLYHPSDLPCHGRRGHPGRCPQTGKPAPKINYWTMGAEILALLPDTPGKHAERDFIAAKRLDLETQIRQETGVDCRFRHRIKKA